MGTSNTGNTLLWGISTFLILAALAVGFYIGKNFTKTPVALENGEATVVTKTDTVYQQSPADTIKIELPGDTIRISDPSISSSLDKMNVLYLGVENPLTISSPGISSPDLRVNVTGANIRSSGSNRYQITATRPGTAQLRVQGNGVSVNREFRIKRIPDPVARLSRSSGGAMGNGEFKAQAGVGAFLDDFDFDVRCQITGYNLTYVSRRSDPVESINSGARYNAKSKRLVTQAKPGDTYYFTNVKCKCPGDTASRTINSMVFMIR